MKSILAFLAFLCAFPAAAAKPLDVYFVDVEGGQATLFVSPSGQSMLVDTGWAGFNNRDADRIAAVAKLAGIKQIDYLVTTHYHSDHVGGVPQLSAKLPIRNFVDHGALLEPAQEKLYSAYTAVRDSGKHIEAKPGETIPIKGIDVKVLSAAGNEITSALPGAGQPNPYCKDPQARPVDTTENARSLGTLITYGKFRIIDLGDLTWNKEYELVCPNNKVGTVDVYLVTHHGMNMSSHPAIVDALHPRVAIMNNGARKGGTPEAWTTIHDAPGIQDIWQLHYAVAGGSKTNAAEELIANPSEEGDKGNWLKLSAQPDGVFTVTNGRTGFSKTYKP
ncbi:MAG: beta-lactamase domain protein [Bryobacterales bacterium]|nr:beta-lactamase domain protein [Bryobacterales bacterium]